MEAKFFQNCCSKGNRAYMPYTGNWPYTLVFPPNDERQDQWNAALDPRTYINGRYVCWPDSSNTNWACLSAAPNSYGMRYYEQRKRFESCYRQGRFV